VISSSLFSSGKDDWETPNSFFSILDSEFHFTLDACANSDNFKHECFISEAENALSLDWSKETNGAIWCNPPYSTAKVWVKHAFKCSYNGATIVMLVASRTDTIMFHEYILPFAEIRFVKGRLKFGRCGVRAPTGAPFPSLVAIFRPEYCRNQGLIPPPCSKMNARAFVLKDGSLCD